MIMTEKWSITLLENSVPWSDEWTPETRRVEIDAALLREIIAIDSGEEGLFETLIEMFRHDTEAHVDVLQTAAATGDVGCLTRIGHSLAGEAAQIAASSIATHCRAIETAALRGEFGLASDLAGALIEHLDHFVAAAEDEIARK